MTRRTGAIRTVAAAILLGWAASAMAGHEARVNVQVVLGDGTPAAGAAILITTANYARYRMTGATDTRGRYAAVLINPDWNYMIRAEKEGLAPSQAPVHEAPGAVDSVVMTLYPPAGEASPAEDDAESLLAQGRKAYDAGDYRTAGSFFTRLTQAHRDYATAYYYVGMCDSKLGRLAESRAMFERYLKLSPDGQDAPAAREMLKKLPAN